MRIETLPSPGFLSNGICLRKEAAKSISAVEINAGIPVNSGKSKNAAALKAFFDACSAAVAGLVDAVVPTVVSRTILAATPKRLTILFSEGLDEKFVPAAAAFTLNSGTITSVTVDGPYVYLDATVAYTSGTTTVAYTQPGSTTNLRDLSGNLVASFTAAAITNGIA